MDRTSQLRLAAFPNQRLRKLATKAALYAVCAIAVAGSSFGAEPPVGFATGNADAGRRTYLENCASCHGASLQGGAGPALASASFSGKWLPPTHPEAELLSAMGRMPPLAPGSLSAQQYTDIARFVVEQNMAAPGAPPQVAKLPRPPEGFPSRPVSVKQASDPNAGPTDAELSAAAGPNWLMYNRDYAGQRFSPLAQITTRNVANLRPVCLYQLGEATSFHASPVVYKGRLYITLPHSTFAIDAKTCHKIWQTDFTPEGNEGWAVNRGVAIYHGKLFRGTGDGRLMALDAATGALLWQLRVVDSGEGGFVSLAPIAADGMVFVGEAGADWGSNSHIHAFDTETGQHRWTFNVIPRGNEPGAETWANGSETGGGSVWSSMSYDSATKTLFAGIGNPAPDYDGDKRPGDNLYTNSVVALDSTTGKLRWHIQQIPHDVHDWDTVAAPMIFESGGKPRVAVTNKAGWLYVYDRQTRALVSRQSVTTQQDMDAPVGTSYVHGCPGFLGGVEWNGPALDPVRHLMFVNSVDWCGSFKLVKEERSPGQFYYGGQFQPDPPNTASGWTRAFDSVTGKPAWTIHAPSPMVSALTPTAGGLVFTGNMNGDFLAYDSASGKELYRFNTGGAIAGGIATYAMDGTQYVAVASGNSSRTLWLTTGSPTLVIFALPPQRTRAPASGARRQ